MAEAREIVYLSQAKLDQFLETSHRRGIRLQGWRGEVRLPFASINVNAARPEIASEMAGRLERAVSHIETRSKWYASENLQSGDWVQFEGRIAYGVFTRRGSKIALFFTVPDPTRHSGTRLILHGSAGHILGRKPPGGRLIADEGGSSVDSFVNLLPRLPGLIARLDGNHPLRRMASRFGYLSAGKLQGQVATVEDALSVSPLKYTATLLRGYARVTLVTDLSYTGADKIVTASPLYVERYFI